MDFDTAKWSGEGEFTALLLERLRGFEQVVFVRVEDAPASRSDAAYNFISNEIFVAFASRIRRERVRRFGIVPGYREIEEKAMNVAALERVLAEFADVGLPDYSDEGMLQYLRTERIVPPYQTRGYKLVELVRIYEVGSVPRRTTPS
jgi:hypothetical protein